MGTGPDFIPPSLLLFFFFFLVITLSVLGEVSKNSLFSMLRTWAKLGQVMEKPHFIIHFEYLATMCLCGIYIHNWNH